MMQMLYRCEQNLIIKGLKWPFMSGAAPLCHSFSEVPDIACAEQGKCTYEYFPSVV